MATTATIYPYDVRQTTGGHYQPFTKLNSIKQASGYAVSTDYIAIKNGVKHTPSTINAYFNVNLPANAEVRKVTVEYKHYVTKAPTSRIFAILPAPNLVLTSKINSDARTAYGEFDAKGQSPGPVAINQQCTFNLTQYKDIPLSFFNNGNLRVVLQYKKNNSKYSGKVHLAYIRVRIEYVTPDFDVTMSKVSGGYNREELSLKATISNYNLTKGDPVVNLQLPLGVSFVRASGNGTVTQPQNRVLTWTPKVNRAGNVSVEIVVVPNVSYSSSDKVWTDSIAYTMPSFNRSKSLSITVTERPPKEDESKADDEPAPIDEGTETQIEWEKVAVNEKISLTGFDEDVSRKDKVIHIFPVNINKEIQLLREDTPALLGYVDNNTYRTIMIDFVMNSDHWGYGEINSKYILKDITFLEKGLYCVVFYRDLLGEAESNSYEYNAQCVNEGTGEFYKYAYFMVAPQESDLSTPNMSILQPNEEELDRLGDGYTYTLQSDMTLNTSEDYVRDWYKNFRIGVFNNPITANQHSYILLQTEETSQVRDLTIPSRFDLTDASMKFTVDKPLTAIIDETTYNLTGTTSIPLWEDYSQSITFNKVSDNVTLTLELYDSGNNLLWSQDYHLVFDAEETLIPTPITEDSTDYNNLTDTEIFTNAQWWSETQAGLNTSNNVECQFTYDENYPLYILYTGDYPEGDPNNNTVTFNEPCIIEDYEQRLTNGLFIEPIDDSVKDDGSLSTITMNAFDISNTIVLYDLPLDDGYGTDSGMAIRGIELTGEVEQTDRLILYAKLRSPTGESRQRSIIIEDTNDFSIGGNGDLWGYNTLDMVNLEDWEIELTISNNLEEVNGNLTLGNLQLNIYVERVEPSNIVCYINGEDLRYYGVFITDVSIPEGLQTDTRYLEVDGTDHNDPYNQSIRQKEIKIEFELGNDCDLQANTLSRRELAKLLVNDRDEYNRPIPNTIEFSHYPDIYWEYIMEDAIEDKIEIGSYTDGKVTLVVPAGTAYDKESTTTSNTGYVNGLATINPILIVKPTDEIITIREEVTGQEFHMGYSGEWNDKILEIDCEDRIAWLKTDEDDTDPINLNRYVDFNSDWFRLKGEFNFVGINCIIRTVDYQERW